MNCMRPPGIVIMINLCNMILYHTKMPELGANDSGTERKITTIAPGTNWGNL